MNKNRLILIALMFLVSIYSLGCSFSTEGYNYESALAQYNKGDYKAAKNYIDKVIKANPEKAEYYILAGHIYIEIDDFKGAIENFSKAITDSKKVIALENNKEAIRGKGVAYLENKEYENAIKEFDKALSIEVNDNMNKDILKYKIESIMYSNQIDEAMKFTENYITTYGKDDDISLLQGKCYAYKKDETQMLEKFNAVIKSGNNDAYYYLANAYEIIGNYEQAIANYELYIAKANGVDKGLVALAMVKCLDKAEMFDKALEVLAKYGKDTKSDYVKEFAIYEITLLEKQGNYNDALTKAKAYMELYKDDEAMAKEVSFLETRITQ